MTLKQYIKIIKIIGNDKGLCPQLRISICDKHTNIMCKEWKICDLIEFSKLVWGAEIMSVSPFDPNKTVKIQLDICNQKSHENRIKCNSSGSLYDVDRYELSLIEKEFEKEN